MLGSICECGLLLLPQRPCPAQGQSGGQPAVQHHEGVPEEDAAHGGPGVGAEHHDPGMIMVLGIVIQVQGCVLLPLCVARGGREPEQKGQLGQPVTGTHPSCNYGSYTSSIQQSKKKAGLTSAMSSVVQLSAQHHWGAAHEERCKLGIRCATQGRSCNLAEHCGWGVGKQAKWQSTMAPLSKSTFGSERGEQSKLVPMSNIMDDSKAKGQSTLVLSSKATVGSECNEQSISVAMDHARVGRAATGQSSEAQMSSAIQV
eukprot:1160834-Pelagomonas_calceolata.AAC.3